MSLAGAPVLWSEAFQAPASASAQAPGSASAASTAGFVELSPAHAMKPAELHDALAADLAVSRVVYNSTKTLEGNPGNHYMEQSLLAYVIGFPGKPLEFELVLHQHVKPSPASSYTVTVCFKPPPEGMEAVAWQVLMRVVQGKELMPVWARRYARAATERARQRLAEEPEMEDVGASEPGSASPEGPAPEEPPPKKHKPQAEEIPPCYLAANYPSGQCESNSCRLHDPDRKRAITICGGCHVHVGEDHVLPPPAGEMRMCDFVVIPPEAPAGVAGATGGTTRGPGSVSPAASTPDGPPLKRSKVAAESSENETKESPDWSQEEGPPDWAVDA